MDPRTYLHDIQESAAEILEFTEGMSLDDYRTNKLVRAAVERKFEIIGEALNRLKRTAPEHLEKIRETAQIIAFRNLLAHGYDTVSDPIVWDIVQQKLPALIEDVRIRLDAQAVD